MLICLYRLCSENPKVLRDSWKKTVVFKFTRRKMMVFNYIYPE